MSRRLWETRRARRPSSWRATSWWDASGGNAGGERAQLTPGRLLLGIPRVAEVIGEAAEAEQLHAFDTGNRDECGVPGPKVRGAPHRGGVGAHRRVPGEVCRDEDRCLRSLRLHDTDDLSG